jgi:hypothetical protein
MKLYMRMGRRVRFDLENYRTKLVWDYSAKAYSCLLAFMTIVIWLNFEAGKSEP